MLTGREKTTILLSLLGADLSSQILRQLPEDMADLIATGINHLPNPSADVISSVLEEFASFMALPGSVQSKSIEERYKPLDEMPFNTVETQQADINKSPQDILFYAQPKKVAMALAAERSSVAAFILTLLPPVQAKEVISSCLIEGRK